MSPTALVPIADCTEDIEAVTIIDVLRRADVDVTVASVMPALTVTCAHGTKITADVKIDECTEHVYDLIALPGGMPGAEHLRDDIIVKELLEKQKNEEKFFAAICASPAVVLAYHGLINNVHATCYPSFSTSIPMYDDSEVVLDGTCITSQGPGTALSFSIMLVAALCGKDTADKIAKSMRIRS